MKYLVVIDGAGETEDDFSVLVVKAEDAEEAVRRVTSPEMGYGRDDGVAYAAPMHEVSVFSIGDTRVRAVKRYTFNQVVEDLPVTSREFLDVDGGHKEVRLASERQAEARLLEGRARSDEALMTPGTTDEVNDRVHELKKRDRG